MCMCACFEGLKMSLLLISLLFLLDCMREVLKYTSVITRPSSHICMETIVQLHSSMFSWELWRFCTALELCCSTCLVMTSIATLKLYQLL